MSAPPTPREATTEALATVRENDAMQWRIGQIQGFGYGDCRMVRDCALPGPKQCIWRGAKDDEAGMMAALVRAHERIRADAILAALAAAPAETRIALARDLLAGTTHAVVPREPTEAMMAALTGWAQCHGYVEEGYRAMLAASGKAPADG